MKEEMIKLCEQQLSKQFNRLEDIALFNQEKVLNAFKKNRISLRHFNPSTGYGYGDESRDTLNQVSFQHFFRTFLKCQKFLFGYQGVMFRYLHNNEYKLLL